MENKQALIKSTGEILFIEREIILVSVNLDLPDELAEIVKSQMVSTSTEISKNYMDVKMFYDQDNKLQHEITNKSDKNVTTYDLSDGKKYNSTELIIGIENIRDYKIENINK